jgi:hypothetical protein
VLLGVLAQRIELRRLTGVYLTLAALALVLYSPGQGSGDGARHRTGRSPPQPQSSREHAAPEVEGAASPA